MERLTKRCNGIVAYVGSERQNDTGDIPCEVSTQGVREILVRLAEYEDTVRAPKEVTALGELFDYALKESKTLTEQLTLLKHIRELAEADKDGRVVVFQKQGSTVYYIGGAFESHVIAGVLIDSGLERLKATVMPAARDYLVEVPVSSLFTSREEAKRRLKG
uniref:Uncharacterized protein n=1 Tax=Caudovirales sp. ctu3532 TaxID=2827639 RepID=A0A8S5TII9_9CAUD|nr:MAG TPA: hypothetical protein [Caudovirales sp. ctu3532]